MLFTGIVALSGMHQDLDKNGMSPCESFPVKGLNIPKKIIG
jgi:hypothetical protein